MTDSSKSGASSEQDLRGRQSQALSAKPLISVVSPVYGAVGLVAELVRRTREALSAITDKFEIILVEDSSPDGSWEKVAEQAELYPEVRGVRLSRNFGQHSAIFAGLDHARGEWVVVMDCDLQDQPEEIAALFTKAQEGFDLVFAQRIERRDNFVKRLVSKTYYALLSWLTDTHQDHTIANFGIYSRKVVDAVRRMGEHTWFFPTMVRWAGFRQAAIPVKHAARSEGSSSYSIGKLIRLAMNTILAFSDKPLRLTVRLGLSIATVSIIVGIVILLKALSGDYSVEGWPSTIISIWFLGGIVITVLGMIGLYLGKVFEEVKKRPGYLVMEYAGEDPGPEHSVERKS